MSRRQYRKLSPMPLSMVMGAERERYVSTLHTSAGMMTIDVIDRGCGIRDIEHARQPFFTTSEGEERSGMGFTVMESFMDVVEVRSVVGHGTTVRLIK